MNNICYDELEQDDILSDLVNGITYEKFKTLEYKPNLEQCLYCLKFYNEYGVNSMITKNFDGNNYICFHCIFWINYSYDLRKTVDGVYGKTINEYVKQCSSYHNQMDCDKNKDRNCLICDYLNGILFDDISENSKNDNIPIFHIEI